MSSNIIRVPKPRSKSFNKNRPISSLLQSQVRHFHEVEKQMLLEQLTDIQMIRTEAQAADYIREMTQKLHAAGDAKLHAAAEPKPHAAAGAKPRKKERK
jgi:hypothetical protein